MLRERSKPEIGSVNDKAISMVKHQARGRAANKTSHTVKLAVSGKANRLSKPTGQLRQRVYL